MKNNKSTGILGLIGDDLFSSVVQGLVSVLVYGIVFYPFFACLTTKYKLIGSLMGFVYVAIRYEAIMILWLRNGSALNTVTVMIDPKKKHGSRSLSSKRKLLNGASLRR